MHLTRVLAAFVLLSQVFATPPTIDKDVFGMAPKEYYYLRTKVTKKAEGLIRTSTTSMSSFGTFSPTSTTPLSHQTKQTQ
jgi:hypothetical protein